MGARLFILLASVYVLRATPSPSALSLDWYSENVMQGWISSSSSQSRVRVFSRSSSFGRLSPFLQVGADFFSAIQQGETGFSRLYGAPGARWVFGGIELQGQWRAVRPLNATSGWLGDARFLMIGSRFDSSPLSFGLLGDSELYGETVYSSLDQNNLMAAAFWRLSLRAQLDTRHALSLYLEPFGCIDRSGVLFNNRVDLKVGARFQVSEPDISLSLLLAYVRNSFLNPDSHRSEGVRLMLIVGGGA